MNPALTFEPEPFLERTDDFETSDSYEAEFDSYGEAEAEDEEFLDSEPGDEELYEAGGFRPKQVESPGGQRIQNKTPPKPADLVTVAGYGGKKQLHRLAAEAWQALVNAARAAGVKPPLLLPVSGYRDPVRQKQLWQNALRKYGSPDVARKWVAPPGGSAHQTGRAIDFNLGGKNSSGNVAKLRKSRAYLWLVANARRFGFYPYSAEPWHWEYNPPAAASGELPWTEEDGADWAASEADTFGESSETHGNGFLEMESFDEVDPDTLFTSEFEDQASSAGSPDRWVVPADVLAIGEAQSVRYDNSPPWFDDKRNCTGTLTPGAADLRRYILANFPSVKKIGGLNCRPSSASSKVSIHGVGRALDIYIPTVGGRANSTVGDPIANWLVRNASMIGIQYIIWSRVRWNGYPGAGKPHFAPYTRRCPHIKHIHVELNLAGSQRRTPWFAGKNGATPIPSQQGSANPAAELVRFAQRVLNASEGERLSDDGDLGRLTRGALERFRKKYNLGVGGVLDSNTQLALAQRALEEIAQQSMFAQPGVLDAETEQALKTFKSARRLGFDTTLDAATRLALTDALVRRASAPVPVFTPSGLPKSGGGITAPGSQGGATSPRPSSTGTGCKDDRCTSGYIRWMQTSLNPILGIQLELTGKLDSPTIRAIKTFKKSLQLKTKEVYVGPVIERTLIAAGAAPPPPLAKAPCGASLVSELLPLLKKNRGDIPIEFLLGWIEVESGRHLGSLTTICERGYFQLHPGESIKLRRDHDLMGTNAEYSVVGGIALVNDYRQRIDKLSQTFGITRGSDVYWRLVKLCHWIPSAAEKILTKMRRDGISVTDWNSISTFAKDHSSSLKTIIERDPVDGIRGVDKMFKAVENWRKKLSLSSP